MEAATKSTAKEIFGSFMLGPSEYAISVSYIQEVVNAPEKFTSVPLCPPFLLGLYNLRGAIIPVVNLRNLLGQPESQEKPLEPKIAVIELGSLCIGLLFDGTHEIFRNNDEERSDFNTVRSHPVVQGVFKKDSGKRLVLILDVEAIFDLKGLPLDQNAHRSHRRSVNRKGQRKQCISFDVGPAHCAFGIGEIHEIVKVSQLTETTLSFGNCLGVIDIRGTTVPVIDFAALLKYRERDVSNTATQGERRIIVLRLGAELLGLLVDKVDSILSYFDEDLKSFPAIQCSKAGMFQGCLSFSENRDILLLNSKEVLSDAEILEITQGHSLLYQEKGLHGDTKSQKSQRMTFITFKVDSEFAIAIEEIREIIDMPKDLMKPPGLSGFCQGVLNLRGEMVTILDARKIYELPVADLTQGKVLIFRNQKEPFGVIVDSVEEIVLVNASSKIQMPASLYSSIGGMGSDVQEAFQCADNSGKVRNLLILKSESIDRRITVNAPAAKKFA